MKAFPRETFIIKAKEENHSAEFIEECLAYIDKLEAKNVPVIFSLQHLSIEVGMKSDFIQYLIRNRNLQYSFFLMKKRNLNSASREIMAPKEQLKYLQRWININILQQVEFNEHVHGFVPGTSILKHAQAHHKAKYLLKIDLLKFFDSIPEHRVYKVFRSFGYVKNLAWDFAKICTAQHRKSYWESFNSKDAKILHDYISKYPYVLPQGAPTSPLLANLVASHMDIRFSKLSKIKGFTYTRYADDLCFSSNDSSSLPSLGLLNQIISEEGFFLNAEKVQYSKEGMKQYVTGLAISGKNAVSISKKKRREIFSHLYYAVKYGIEAHIIRLKKNGSKFTNYQNWLLGHISYQYSIDKKIGKKMFDMYNRINWSIDIDIGKKKSNNDYE